LISFNDRVITHQFLYINSSGYRCRKASNDRVSKGLRSCLTSNSTGIASPDNGGGQKGVGIFVILLVENHKIHLTVLISTSCLSASKSLNILSAIIMFTKIFVSIRFFFETNIPLLPIRV
jgi:hypothetical protein